MNVLANCSDQVAVCGFINGCGLVTWNTDYDRNLACLLIVSFFLL